MQFRYLCLAVTLALTISPFHLYAADTQKTAEEEAVVQKYLDSPEGDTPYQWPPKRKVEWKEVPKQERDIDRAMKALDSSDFPAFERAAYQFEQLGEKAIPSLVQVLDAKGYSSRVYVNAIYMTGRIGEEAEGAVTSLTPYLQNKDADFRAVAARTLGKIGAKADRSVPQLRKLLNDETQWVREVARESLLSIGTPNALRAIKEQNAAQQKAAGNG